MSDHENFTCIGCPMGCPLQLTHEGGEIREVTGYACKRGEKYARQEFTDPRRSVSTTVPISGALWNRMPVKVTAPVPKGKVLAAVRQIHGLKLRAPVAQGQVLIENILGETGIHVVATRTMG